MTSRPDADRPDQDPSASDPSSTGDGPPAGDGGTPAERIIERFGGIRPTARKLEIPVTTVQGWKKRGAIPVAHHAELLAAAARYNIPLDPRELEAAAGGDEPAPAEPPAGREPDEAQPAAPGPAPEAEAPAPVPRETAPGSAPAPDQREAPGREDDAGAPRDPERAEAEPVSALVSAAALRPARGARNTALAAAVLALLGAGAAITAPLWSERVLRELGLAPPAPAVDVAALDRQVAELEQRIGTLSEQVAAAAGLERQVAALDSRLAALSQQVAELPTDPQAQVPEELRQQIADLAARVAELSAQPGGATGDAVTAAELDQRLAPLERQVVALSGSVDQLRQEVQPLPQVSDQLAQLTQAVAQLQSESPANRQLAQSVAALETEANRLADQLAQLTQRADTLAQQLQEQQRSENRTEALVLAASQLRTVLETSQPFRAELAAVTALGLEDAELRQALEAIAPYADTGIPTLIRLRQRFDRVAADIARLATLGDDEGWIGQTLQQLGALVSIRRRAADIEGTDTQALLARAAAHLEDGNLAAAVEELSRLEGAPAQAAQPWLQDARVRLAANRVAALLTGQAIARLADAPNATVQ